MFNCISESVSQPVLKLVPCYQDPILRKSTSVSLFKLVSCMWQGVDGEFILTGQTGRRGPRGRDGPPGPKGLRGPDGKKMDEPGD